MFSSKERTRKYRKRLKEDETKYKEVKNKDKERKKFDYWKKKLLTPEALRAKEREKKRKQRQKKAENKKKTVVINTKKISPQVLGRACNRAKKNLPRSPHRQVHVLAKLVQNLSPRKRKSVIDLCDVSQKRRKLEFEEQRKKRCDALSDEAIKEVQDFYARDDISRMLPGKKDYKSVKLPEGKREHHQKRQLLYKISEAHQLFKEESSLKIEKSKFAELRPPHILPLSSIDQEVCICIYHENLDLLLQGLSKITSKCWSSEEAVAQTVCSLDTLKCVDRDCDSCGVTHLTDSLTQSLDEDSSISYHQWQKVDGLMKKVLVQTTLYEATCHLQTLLTPFSRHVYNIRRQFQELKHLKQNLKDDEVIIHEDFSENFQIRNQREVMASHWSKELVTVFTAVVYYKENNELKNQSYAVISDDLRHEKGSIYIFNKEILKAITEKLGKQVNTVHYWTDGVWSQFKNRFNLTSILYHPYDFKCEATWNFFETAHGKGAVDGVGGAVKRAVWRAILQNRAVVNSAQEFSVVANDECKKVEVIFVPKEEIDQIEEKLCKRWEVAVPIPQTPSIHFAKRKSSSTVYVAKNSQFKQQELCIEHCLIPGSSELQSPPLVTDKKRKNIKTTQNPTHPVTTENKKTKPTHSLNKKSKTTKNSSSSPKIECKLPKSIKNNLSHSVSYTLPSYQEAVVTALLEKGIAFRGKSPVNIDDLIAVSGLNAVNSEDKWLSNFIIDEYLQILSATSVDKNIAAIRWELFEKLDEEKLATNYLKKSVYEHDNIFVPCNPEGGSHWFLLCLLPKCKQLVVLDSSPTDGVKITHERSAAKMLKAVAAVDNSFIPSEWKCYTNHPDDLQVQDNDYDCGVYVCMYARSLALDYPLIYNVDMPEVRKSIIHDLHVQSVSQVPSPGIEVGLYYAVDYINQFYYGRVISINDNMVTVKFLHATSSSTFDWPRRDDVETLHASSVFYGPVEIEGNGPFFIPMHREVAKVHLLINKK